MWSYEHDAWWRANSCGYTPHLHEAGFYTEAKAKEIERRANEFATTLQERAVSIAEEMEKYASLLRAARGGSEPERRSCFLCGRNLGHVGGYCVGRDVIAVMRGEGREIREVCQQCILTGRLHVALGGTDGPLSGGSPPELGRSFSTQDLRDALAAQIGGSMGKAIADSRVELHLKGVTDDSVAAMLRVFAALGDNATDLHDEDPNID